MTPATAQPDLPARLNAYRRRIPLTREGLVWFVIAVGLLTVGLLKGINLITLLASLLVVLVGCNAWLAQAQLRRVRAAPEEDEPAFAQTPFTATVRVRNLSRHPVGGLEVCTGTAPAPHCWPVSDLAAGATAQLYRELTYPRRGYADGESLTITSGYPLGLVQFQRAEAAGERRIVLPQLGRLNRAQLRQLLARRSPTQGPARGLPCPAPTARAEFHGLRPYRPGDSPRHVHWRTTARRGDLMVREYEDWPNDDLTLILEARKEPGDGDDPRLELAIRLAATICWQWCRQSGDRLLLAIAGSTVSVTEGATNRALALSLLQRLALEPGTTEIDGDQLIAELRRYRLSPGPILVISPGESELGAALQHALRRRVAPLAADSEITASFFDAG